MPEQLEHQPRDEDMANVYRQIWEVVDGEPYHALAMRWLELFREVRVLGRDIVFAARGGDEAEA